jgi:hypothetical protein
MGNGPAEYHEVRVRIMRPGEPDEQAVVRLPEQTSPRYYSMLKESVEAVVGGPMERVNVFADFDGGEDYRYTDMFVHEMGQLLYLPRNEPATVLYRNNVLIHEVPAPSPEDLPTIAGAAILFERRVWF